MTSNPLAKDFIFFKPSEVAEMLGLSERKVMELIRMGAIESVRFGKNYRVSLQSFKECLEKFVYKGK